MSSRKNPSKASTNTCLPSSPICVTGEPRFTLLRRGFSCVWRSGFRLHVLTVFFFSSSCVNAVSLQGIGGCCSSAAEGDLRQARCALRTASMVIEVLNYRLSLSHESNLNVGGCRTCPPSQPPESSSRMP